MRAQAIAALIGVGLGAVGCGSSGEAPWPDAVAAQVVEVHIPPRGEWVDAWSGQTMTPGQTVQVAVPEHKIPIYIRAGSQVDLGDLPARWQSAQQRTQTPPDLDALAAEVE